MDKKVKWGIIAVGGIAKRRVLPAMKHFSNAEIIAVMDKNTNVFEEIKENYGIYNFYEDENELLKNPEIDAVYVASPVCFHKEHAIKVLKAGKHLLLEKPIGLNLKEAEEIRNFALDYSNVKFGIGMILKMHPLHQKMREIVKKGVLGDIVCCRAQMSCWFPEMKNNWRQSIAMGGGGALVDMGVHCVDLIRYLLDDDVDKVYADVATKTFNYEVDDSADCIIRMKKGTSCFIDVHFNVPDNSSKGFLEIYGTKGSIIADGTMGQDGLGTAYLSVSEECGYNANQNRHEDGGSKQIQYEVVDMYVSQITNFSDEILNNRGFYTTIDNAFETSRIIDALYRSARQEKVIKL